MTKVLVSLARQGSFAEGRAQISVWRVSWDGGGLDRPCDDAWLPGLPACLRAANFPAGPRPGSG